uniref:Uncharacterized protein n=1 Tax=Panagrellus redivivus TaxID=6233 RepID=A0A7E4VHW6_PANRE
MHHFILPYFYYLIAPITTCLKKETLPFDTLCHNFKKRLANLAPVADIGTLCKICPEIKQLCSDRQIYYVDQVSLTDNIFYHLALRKVPFFRRYKLLYKRLRFIIDGIYFFTAPYQSVLKIESLFPKTRKIYVEDTLFLDCVNTESYDKLVASISGPYTRLVLGGNITWAQAKLLIHSKVQKVFIHARIKIEPEEYDDFVAFVVQHSGSFHSCFHLQSNAIPELRAKVSDAFTNHNTHVYVLLPELYNRWIVYHKGYALCYLTRWFIARGVPIVLTCLLGYMTSLKVFFVDDIDADTIDLEQLRSFTGPALEKAQFFRQFKFLYKHFRFFIDGIYYFVATYHSVLFVDHLFVENQKIYVKDTLFLDCERTKSYDEVIPLIYGPYTRLILSGNITWAQAKRLIHSKVQKVYIYADIEIEQHEYDDFATFVVQHSHSFHSCFHVRYNTISELKAKVSEAFYHHDTHLYLSRGNRWFVYDKTYVRCYTVRWFAALGFQLFFTCLFGYMTSWYCFVPLALLGCVINVATIRHYLRIGNLNFE